MKPTGLWPILCICLCGDLELGTHELDETELPQTKIQHCNQEVGETWYFEDYVKLDLGTKY